MFCPECGKSNPNELKNCQYCNAELLDNSNRNSVKINVGKYVEILKSIDYSKYFNLLKSKKKILIPVLSALILVIGFVIVGKFMSSPKRIAESYAKCYINQDFNKMYNYMVLPENSEFINKDTFSEYMMQNNKNYGSKILNYNIKEQTKEENSITFYMSYITEESLQEKTIPIYLIRQNQKSWLFFDKYEIGLNMGICYDYSIYAPKSLNVEIDGIALKGEQTAENKNMNKFYINSIFCGNHKVKVTGDMIKDYQQEIYIDNSNNFFTFDNDYLELNEETILTLTEQSKADIQEIYQSAIEGKNCSDVNVKMSNYFNGFYYTYDDIYSDVKYHEITNVKFGHFDNATSNFHLNSDFVCTFEQHVEYAYEYKTKLDDSEVINDSRIIYDTIKFSYRYENGTWSLYNLANYRLKY